MHSSQERRDQTIIGRSTRHPCSTANARGKRSVARSTASAVRTTTHALPTAGVAVGARTE